MNRRPSGWSGAGALLIALIVVGTLALLAPGDEDPVRVRTGTLGEWSELADVQIRITEVRVADRITVRGEEQQALPGARFVVVTAEAETLTTVGSMINRSSLQVGGATYEPEPELSAFVDADPGFVSRGQVGFIVPQERAGRGTLVLSSSRLLYTGMVTDAVHVDIDAARHVPGIVLGEGEVRPR